MALRGAEVFHSPLPVLGAKASELNLVQQPTMDRSLDTLPTPTSLGDSRIWVVESREERDQREIGWGIARYIQEGGQITSGDVHVGNAAFWQAVRLAEESGEILAPDEIYLYITKRSVVLEGSHKSDRVIFEEVLSEREVSQPVLVFEPAT